MENNHKTAVRVGERFPQEARFRAAGVVRRFCQGEAEKGRVFRQLFCPFIAEGVGFVYGERRIERRDGHGRLGMGGEGVLQAALQRRDFVRAEHEQGALRSLGRPRQTCDAFVKFKAGAELSEAVNKK